MNISEIKKKKRGKWANHKSLLTIANKLRVAEGEVGKEWAKCVVGIKENDLMSSRCYI